MPNLPENRHAGHPASMVIPSPAQIDGAEVPVSDTVDLPEYYRGFILNAEATIKYDDLDGVSHVFTFPAGDYAISLRRVWETGTDALDDIFLGIL